MSDISSNLNFTAVGLLLLLLGQEVHTGDAAYTVTSGDISQTAGGAK